jgi:sugar phosphate isomerase/epimerase
MIFGMSTASFFMNLYNEDAIIQIGKMGIKNIEVFFAAGSEYEQSYVYDLKKRADEFGINIYSIHALTTQFEPQMFSSHKRQKDEAYDVYKKVLRAGQILDADVFVFHGPNNIKIAKTLNINYEYTANRIDEAANLAKDYGIKFSYETVHWCWYAKPDFPAKLNEFITSDNLYYTLDIKQAAQSKFSPCEYIDGMLGRLANIHICDFLVSEELGIVPKLPFNGSYDFSKLRQKLVDIDYQGGMILEVYRNNYENYEQLNINYQKMVRFFD